MNPNTLRALAESPTGDDAVLLAHADAWEAERVERHMEAAQFLSKISAWKGSCKAAEKRLAAARRDLQHWQEVADARQCPCRIGAKKAVIAAGEENWVPHIVREGSREHVTWWDFYGAHCSEPLCEVNRPSEEKKMTETKLDDIVGHTTKGIVPNPLFALAEKLMASDKDFYWVIEQLNSAKYVWQAERVQTAEREAAYAELKALLDKLGPKTDDLLAEAKHLRAEAPDLVHARDLLAQALSRFAQKDKALRFALDNLRDIAIPMADAAGRVTSLNHAQRMIEQALGEDTRICVWTYDFHDDMWNTACGECFVFEEGTPLSNNHKFCGYCGKPIKELLVDNPPLP